jgi:hypothetical protein
MANRRPTKGTKKQAGEESPRKAVPVTAGKTEDESGRNYAGVLTSPELAAYRVINGAEIKSGLGDQIDVPSMLAVLRESAARVNAGKLDNAEAMLMNQATALQSLFARLAERAMTHDQIPGFDANMRMALRAQNQCRATLETLATIKNPPIVYARQANVTTGPQQINNGVALEASRTRENENQQSKLMEDQHGEWVDTGTAGATSGADKAMATVGEIDGAKNGGG